MMEKKKLTRRNVLTGGVIGSTALLAGCNPFAGDFSIRKFLGLGEWLNYRVQTFVAGDSLAREYTEAEMSPYFRMNGNIAASSSAWQQLAANNFVDYQLAIDGLVDTPQALSLADIQAMPSRTQITRHDCVEGWSAIGKWTGVQLSSLLNMAGVSPQAKFVVFHCADDFNGTPYYESIDLEEAFHPQTILAYGMNGGVLPMGHGAPLRLRVERQLGYKQAKFIMRIEVVDSLDGIGEGKGGFWEDAGDYDWYAGI